MSRIQLLKEVWASLYDPRNDVAQAIETYFHPDYQQCINGVVMSRTQYIDHVIAQKKNMVVNDIEYLQAIEDGDQLFALYTPKGKNNKGEDIDAEVVSYFRFQGNQILEIHGQVRLISGSLSDVDM